MLMRRSWCENGELGGLGDREGKEVKETGAKAYSFSPWSHFVNSKT